MSGREAALWVITALSAVAVAGVAASVFARRYRKTSPGIEILALAVGLTCGMWAGIGWAWWLSGGVVS